MPFRGDYFSANRQFLGQLPIKLVDPKNKSEVKLEKEIVERVEAIQAAHSQRVKLPDVLHRKIAHTQNRTPCNLAHYLQKDFAAAVKPEILIDDVQRTGFVHEIRLESEGAQATACAAGDPRTEREARAKPRLLSGVHFHSSAGADRSGGSPAHPASSARRKTALPLPILRLAFKDDALRQFIYAAGGSSWMPTRARKMDDRQKAGADLSAARQHARTAGLFQLRRRATICAPSAI